MCAWAVSLTLGCSLQCKEGGLERKLSSRKMRLLRLLEREFRGPVGHKYRGGY